LTFDTRLSVAFALLEATGLLDLEVGFTAGVACAADLVFDMGFAICPGCGCLEVAFAFGLAFGAGCLASPLIA